MTPQERAKNKKYKYLACVNCGGDLPKQVITGKYCIDCSNSKLLLGKILEAKEGYDY